MNSTYNKDIKRAVTEMVVHSIVTGTGKKSGGTVISTITRELPLILVKPFSK